MASCDRQERRDLAPRLSLTCGPGLLTLCWNVAASRERFERLVLVVVVMVLVPVVMVVVVCCGRW